MLRSGPNLPTLAKDRTMLVALYKSASSEALKGTLSHALATLLSVTSCTAGCTALVIVPAQGIVHSCRWKSMQQTVLCIGIPQTADDGQHRHGMESMMDAVLERHTV